jgi:hypothetical protein
MGYDFHLAADGPKLIEINTNAGGAFLNALLAKAQHACCAEMLDGLTAADIAGFDAAVARMFRAEWNSQRGGGVPHHIVIVDDEPEEQYLYPEFILAQRLLERQGFEASIADPRALRYEDGRLQLGGKTVDLVYNRLVDFALDQSDHAALRAAYLDGAVVVTPNPHLHALFADKRNLTLLCDDTRLAEWGLDAASRADLARGVPRTMAVVPDNAANLWAARKKLFFKPAAGYGGKAVYRGDKVTKGVWADIVAGGYVAQDFAAPSERMMRIDTETVSRKTDFRLYTYDGAVLLKAARLYQGQTTNFRRAAVSRRSSPFESARDRRLLKHPLHQFSERVGAVADRMFPFRFDLAVAFEHAVGDEHRIVTEAVVALGRPDERTMHDAFDGFAMAVGPGKRQRADEAGATIAFALEQIFDAPHGEIEILVGARPARGIDAGIAAQRIHREAGIVGERRQARAECRGQRLQFRIGDEGGSGFVRFGQSEIAGRNDVGNIIGEKVADLDQLALIVAGDDEFFTFKFSRHV